MEELLADMLTCVVQHIEQRKSTESEETVESDESVESEVTGDEPQCSPEAPLTREKLQEVLNQYQSHTISMDEFDVLDVIARVSHCNFIIFLVPFQPVANVVPTLTIQLYRCSTSRSHLRGTLQWATRLKF